MKGLSPKLPVQRDSEDGYALTKTYPEMILQNLKNLLLTIPGERMMDPMFGVGVKKFLFEAHSVITYSKIYSKMIVQVKRYMPFVEIEDAIFYGSEGVWSANEGYIESTDASMADPNKIQIKIFLSIVPLGKQTTLNLDVKV